VIVGICIFAGLWVNKKRHKKEGITIAD